MHIHLSHRPAAMLRSRYVHSALLAVVVAFALLQLIHNVVRSDEPPETPAKPTPTVTFAALMIDQTRVISVGGVQQRVELTHGWRRLG